MALLVGGCGDGGASDESTAPPAAPDRAGTEVGGSLVAPGVGDRTGRSDTTTAAEPGDRGRIERAVSRYIGSLDSGDGSGLCSLLAPGALAGIDLPSSRPSCAASLQASIGHPSPTGSPRWLGTRLVDADSVVIVNGAEGRFTGTVVHRFAGGREPSIEDDVIYLRRVDGRWLIAKPSATFYRAIGARDVPITALTPP